MDENVFLLVIVAVSCVVLLFRSVTSPMRRSVRGWIIVSVAILAVCGATYAVIPDYSGLISFVLWLIFILIPSLTSRWVAQLIYRQQFKQAERWSRVAAILHPFDDWQVQPQIVHALALAQQGKASAAIDIFKRYEATTTPMASTAKLHLYRLQNRWNDLISALEQSPDLRMNPNSINAYIRALGETGNLNRMVAAYWQYHPVLENARIASLTALFIFGFTGRREQLERLFASSLHLYPKPLQLYWLGVADFAAGNPERAQQELQEAINATDQNIGHAARYRLAHPIPVAEPSLTPESVRLIQNVEREIDQEQRFGTVPYIRRTRPYATYALIVINVVVFLLEMALGGSTDIETLFKMGALVPSVVVWQGEWWRLLAAMFLHYGFLHIAANMFALLILGPFVEHVLGVGRYLLTYFVAGLLSMLIIVGLTQAHMMPNDILVGASGAIMGLIGAMGAIMYRGWRVEKAPVARQRLLQIVAIVLLQVFIDFAIIPQSSLQGHLGGAIIGFIVASLIRHHVREQGGTAKATA